MQTTRSQNHILNTSRFVSALIDSREELVFEELVGDEPLREDDDEVELLARAEPGGVHVVLVVEVLLKKGQTRLSSSSS